MLRRSSLLAWLPVVLVLLVGAFVQARAGMTRNNLTVDGLVQLILSTDAATTAVARVDSGTRTGKRAWTYHFVVNGQDVYVFERLQVDRAGWFLDAIAAESTTALAARVDAMEFTGRNHPSPTKDAADDALTDGFAGWNGY